MDIDDAPPPPLDNGDDEAPPPLPPPLDAGGDDDAAPPPPTFDSLDFGEIDAIVASVDDLADVDADEKFEFGVGNGTMEINYDD